MKEGITKEEQMPNPYELTEREKALVGSNSIERVINTSVNLLHKHAPVESDDLALVNIEDWSALKNVVCKLWQRAAAEIRAERSRGNA
jgi:hypothetical protein